MAAAESHRLSRQIVIAMLAGMVLGVIMNRVGTPSWVKLGLVDGLLHVVGTVDDGGAAGVRVASGRCDVPVRPECARTHRRQGTLLYLATTTIAVTIALTLEGIVGPGHGFDAGATAASFSVKEPPPLMQAQIGMVPTNPVA
jgi:Na+/H+-dicarboxylate symporter